MQGGDSHDGEAVVLDVQIILVLLLSLRVLPPKPRHRHRHCPSHSEHLTNTLKYRGFERTWAKAQWEGSSLPNHLPL